MIKKLAVTSLAAATLAVAFASTASAASCYDLWYERNEIYNTYGYCFKTRLGKQTFDNSDCQTSNPRLSRADSKRVAYLKKQERRKGCKVN